MTVTLLFSWQTFLLIVWQKTSNFTPWLTLVYLSHPLSGAYMSLEDLSEKQLQIYYGEYNGKRKSALAAYLFLLFLGCLGAHKFYVGSALGGLFYLFFSFISLLMPVCWIFIAIGFFIDLCTLPYQVNRSNSETKKRILTDLLNKRKGFVDLRKHKMNHPKDEKHEPEVLEDSESDS